MRCCGPRSAPHGMQPSTASRSASGPGWRCELAAAHAATTCVGVVDTAWTLAGGTAVYDTSVLGRCVRDAHVVTQHIMVAPKLNETLGKFLLGVEFNAAMI